MLYDVSGSKTYQLLFQVASLVEDRLHSPKVTTTSNETKTRNPLILWGQMISLVYETPVDLVKAIIIAIIIVAEDKINICIL